MSGFTHLMNFCDGTKACVAVEDAMKRDSDFGVI